MGVLVVWKALLQLTDQQTVEMPAGAKPIAAQLQGDGGPLSLWFLCDPYAPKVARQIRIHGTGHALRDDPGDYVDTFQLSGGALVFHVFAKPEAAGVH